MTEIIIDYEIYQPSVFDYYRIIGIIEEGEKTWQEKKH